MEIPDEIKNLQKDSVTFAKQKPQTLTEIWPWGLGLAKLLRPVAQFQGDAIMLYYLDELEAACKEKNEERLDSALIKMNEVKKAQMNMAYRMAKGGVRRFVRPFTNVIRKAIGKDAIESEKTE